ncbi:HNH endonuclease [Sinorhizobium meliloti]|uniref:HNH endonuclease n=1 Tax=Rhizobium meliloti TaxID=382 RepID=UPI000FDCC95F|nr:HNH endonuclease [Sinorhizobium meliloti]RVH04377.1 HNH endonuclease [Sinorhizobium meliloti]
MNNFVFLNLPESFRLVEALADGKRDFWWRTTRLKNDIDVGDRVFMWQGKGKEEKYRGVHAIATVTEKPRRLAPSEFDGYWVGEQSKAFEDEHTRLQIIEYAEPGQHLRQGLIHTIPLLAAKGVFDGAQGVNFTLSPDEAEELADLWRLHVNAKAPGTTARQPIDIERKFDESARDQLERHVTSLQDKSLDELERIIAKAPKDRDEKTSKIVVAGHPRDPAVAAYARVRAGNQCEVEGCEIPLFETTYGRRFVEVHHIVPLGEGGKDRIENVACVCPSHHREAHHGKNSRLIQASLKGLRSRPSRPTH